MRVVAEAVGAECWVLVGIVIDREISAGVVIAQPSSPALADAGNAVDSVGVIGCHILALGQCLLDFGSADCHYQVAHIYSRVSHLLVAWLPAVVVELEALAAAVRDLLSLHLVASGRVAWVTGCFH